MFAPVQGTFECTYWHTFVHLVAILRSSVLEQSTSLPSRPRLCNATGAAGPCSDLQQVLTAPLTPSSPGARQGRRVGMHDIHSMIIGAIRRL